jgi:hypothetical protein
MYHMPEPKSQAAHLKIVPINGTETLLKRLASSETVEMRDRVEAVGVDRRFLVDFEKKTKELMVRAIHEEPHDLRNDVDRIAKRMSRSALFGSRRIEIETKVTSAVMAGLRMIHHRAQPAEPQNPFEVSPVAEKSVGLEFA